MKRPANKPNKQGAPAAPPQISASKATDKSRLSIRLRPSATTLIASLALIVSVGQLIVSSPILIGLYWHPKLEVTDMEHGDGSFTFYIRNAGRADARNQETVISDFYPGEATVSPPIGAELSWDRERKSYRVLVQRLGSGDSYTIRIKRDMDRDRAGTAPDGRQEFGTPALIRPIVLIFRSDEGIGKFERDPAAIDILFETYENESTN